MLDVRIENHGSLMIFQPLTDYASAWIDEYVGPGANWYAGGLVVEPRYGEDLAQEMRDSGLAVE